MLHLTNEEYEAKLLEEFPEMFESKQMYISDFPKGWRELIYLTTKTLYIYSYKSKRSRVKNTLNAKVKVYLNRKWYPVYRKLIQVSQSKKGWRKYLYTATNKFGTSLFSVSDCYERVDNPAVKVGQIKEKFGTLRYYVDGYDDWIQGMLDLAEMISSHTCQETGEPGQLCVRGGWYATLSPKVAKELNFSVVNRK
jgi:hypothetical protein